MYKYLLALLVTLPCFNLYAQTWDVNVAAGLNYSRLLPVGGSTKATQYIRYGFMPYGGYIGAELFIHLNERSRFSFSYQLSQSATGINLRAAKSSDTYSFFEDATTHSFSVGYHKVYSVAADKVSIGWHSKAGIAYGYNTGGGSESRGSSAAPVQSAGYVQGTALHSDSIMMRFWIPVVSAGASIGFGTASNRRVADRLQFTMSLVAGLKDIYTDYARVKYVIATPASYEEGTARYRGLPLLLQVGLNYRLFRMRRE